MFQRPGPGPYVEMHHGGGHPWFGLLVFLLLLGTLVFAALAFWRTARQPEPVASRAAPVPAGPDPALAELRLRYARGEIDRDDYLQRATDLGGAAPAPPPVQPDSNA
jgi:putative membrane protein